MAPILLNAEPPTAQPTAEPLQQRPPRFARTTFPDASDEQLVACSRAGDPAAFAEIVRRHRPELLARCRRMLGADAAEDAVQLAFVSAWRALRDGCEVSNLRGWLLAIARRSALQAIRARPPETGAIPETIASNETPADQLERRQRARATLAALADLPAGERDALLMAVVQGRSGRDTARALGISEGAVRQLVFRGRARLRGALAAPVPLPLLTQLVSRLRARAAHAAARAAHGGSPAPVGTASVAGRAAAVVVAGALAAAPLAIHTARGHAPHHATTGAQEAVAQSAGRSRVTGASAAALSSRAARRSRASGAGATTVAGSGRAPAGATTRATGADAGAGDGAATGGSAGSAASSGEDAHPAHPAGTPQPAPHRALGGVTSGAGSVAGGTVEAGGQQAGGAQGGVTHSAEAVLGHVTGAVNGAAPVVGDTVHAAGQAVSQTGEAVKGVLEQALPPPPAKAPEERATPLGGLLGR
jgi:RNA polymerase sigma-70 factor (ECF subfamily)